MSVTVTTSQLQKICRTDAGKAAAGTYTTVINMAMANWGINNPLRAAMFLAQVIYETAEFQAFAETGAATYRGRGAFRIAGEDQYKALGKSLSQDLLTHPEYLLLPGFAFEAAGWVWTRDGHNDFADGGNVVGSARMLVEAGCSYMGHDNQARSAYYAAAVDALDADVVQHPLDGDPVASDTGASTTDGYLRWLRDWYYTNFGAKNDAVAVNDDGAYTIIGRLKRISYYLSSILNAFSNRPSSAVLYAVGNSLVVPAGDCGAVGIQITGTNAGGVITFKASQDGGLTYFAVNAIPISSGGDNNPTATASAAGNFVIIGGGFTHVKAELTSAGAGSFSVSAVATPAHRNVGVPAIGSAMDTAASSDTGTGTLIQLVKRLLTKTPDPTIAVTTGTFNQIGDEVVLQVPVGHSSATMVMYGTYTSVTGSFYFQLDGQWFVFGAHNDSAQTSSLNTAAATAGAAMQFAIPAGATAIKCACTAFGSKTSLTVVVASSTRQPHTQVGSILLGTGTARIGNAGRPGIWYSDTSAALGSNSTFTSTSRDLSGVAASGVVFGASYASSYRVSVVQDVAFTVYLEVSADNSTFRRIKKVDATQNITGGLYVAEYDEVPKWRYYRYVIANGASAAAFTNGSSIVLG